MTAPALTPAQVQANRRALPRVLRVALTPDGVRLPLSDGTALTLTGTARASLTPVGRDGVALLAFEWGRPDVRRAAVPAHLWPALAPHFDGLALNTPRGRA